MHDARVRSRRAAGHIVACLKHHDVQTPARQCTRRRRAGNAGSHDRNVDALQRFGIHVVQLTIYPR